MAGSSGKKGGGGLDGEGLRLWRAFTRDVEPLTETDWDALERALAPDDAGKAASVSPKTENKQAPSPQRPEKPPSKGGQSQPPQLDARLEGRLRKGKVPIDGTLDLHGMTQERAYVRLQEFVLGAHRRGGRCLLVITGKGRGGLPARDAYAPDLPAGILKRRVPDWLSAPPLRDITLKVFPAAQKDGGSGAFYVYLRRMRGPDPY